MRKKMTVQSLWKLAKASEIKLLGNFTADWWAHYTQNSEAMDRYFVRKFKTFEYRGAEVGMEVDEVLAQWIQDVEDILMVNSEKFKRLAELKALEYDATADHYSETVTDKDVSYDKGSRTDSGSTDQGAQTGSNSAYTTPFDSGVLTQTGENVAQTGARHDATSMTSGAQHDDTAEDTTVTTQGYSTNPSDNAMKYKTFWMSYAFYDTVFGVILKELLMVGGGC